MRFGPPTPLLGMMTTGCGRSGGGSVSVLATATARWDASALSGADNDLIATFADVIGSNDATAAGSARGTLKTANQNGLNILRFDGVANTYDLTTPIEGAGPWTFAVVAKSAGPFPLMSPGGMYFGGFARTSSSEIGDKGHWQVATSSLAVGSWEVMIFSHDGTAAGGSIWIDGVAITLGSPNGPVGGVTGGDFQVIGEYGNNYLGNGGDIGEIAYWPSVLSDDDKLAASTELSTKWGI